MCAAALAGTAATVSDADAAVVTFSTPISVTNNFDGTYINFLTGASGPMGSVVAGWDFDPYNASPSVNFYWNPAALPAGGVAGSTDGPYLDLAAGTTISATSTFAQVTASAGTLPFQTVGTHTLGFRFYNESTSAINYGYATLNSAGAGGFPLTITGWSFENSGGAITVSPVPEPASAAMLSLGALAIGALNLRRLRRQHRRSAR